LRGLTEGVLAAHRLKMRTI